MRNIKKFARENGYTFTESEDFQGFKKIIIDVQGITFIMKERQSNSTFTIRGWQGHSEKYSISDNSSRKHNYSSYFNTQRELIEYIVDTISRIEKEKTEVDKETIQIESKEEKVVQLKQPKTDLEVTLVGEDGNIFNLTGIVSRELKRNGYRELAKELQEKIWEQNSYDEALELLTEYVNVS